MDYGAQQSFTVLSNVNQQSLSSTGFDLTSYSQDPDFQSLLDELMQEPDGVDQQNSKEAATAGSTPLPYITIEDISLPEEIMEEPEPNETRHERPAASAASTGQVKRKVKKVDSTETATSVSTSNDLEDGVHYMKKCLESYDKIVGENGANGKIQVHQVVLFMLLSNLHHTEIRQRLDNILVFCDANGKESSKITDHFLAKDTKKMGLVWQSVKQNRRATFDTFARAMRVGREKSKEYFDYLESGRGSKKRIYKLGQKGRKDLERMEGLLSKICS